jgi:hypothetical protein
MTQKAQVAELHREAPIDTNPPLLMLRSLSLNV